MIESGNRVPDTRLLDRDGKRYALYDLLDRPTLVIVFKTTCSTCRLALPVYDRWRRYEPAVKVLAVSQDTPALTDGFYEDLGVGFETLYDEPPYAMSNAFGVIAVPSLALIEHGQVTWSGHGWVRAEAEELETLLATHAGRRPALVGADDLPVFKPG
ncbi:thiol-disulfide oxidoreductase [bacterium BMS3Abin02]|nr:thiol-disulfide oxidoreductase [bacterium BMS3Abin02]GBE22716.1 thiol-disulfide oxidoreductase [bacterium BMS3Bbin01]HDH24999.1 TlpA family protein disulfide reductase [Actinomycetota bacterium]HDL48720.1 TlpA family protein disulfide reductase [Actinomycetota bacterium]